MPTVLTVMGVECGGTTRFCGATVRPGGPVPVQPILLNNADRLAASKGILWPLGIAGLGLRTWSIRLEGDSEGALHRELDRQSLTLPSTCPFDQGAMVTGKRFGPLPVPEEEGDPTRCTGVGLLRVDGFAVPRGAERIISALRSSLGEHQLGDALERLTAEVSKRAGLGAAYTGERRLMVVERLARAGRGEGPRLLSARIDKSNITSAEPATQMIIRREGAPLESAYRLVVEADCLGMLVSSVMIELAAGVAEVPSSRCDQPRAMRA